MLKRGRWKSRFIEIEIFGQLLNYVNISLSNNSIQRKNFDISNYVTKYSTAYMHINVLFI